jgi:NADH-quinone oxidoreductase subunit N
LWPPSWWLSLSYEHSEKREGDPEELYVLLLLAALGSAVLFVSDHFVSFFLGLELLSVALYALSAYQRDRRQAVEAGIKYLALAASSVAFLLFGMALIYAQVGSMDFTQLGAWVEGGGNIHQTLILVGLALIITGFGFKLVLVPFHLSTPDVYKGVPAPVTAFVATVSKGSVFALLVRFSYGSGSLHLPAIFLTFHHSRYRLDDCRKLPGAPPEQRQAAARLLLHRAHGLSDGSVSGRG